MKITVGKLHFTETNEPISGRPVKGTEERFLGKLLRRRRMPHLKGFQPDGTYYEMWEVVDGNRSDFFDVRWEAENFILISLGNQWGK